MKCVTLPFTAKKAHLAAAIPLIMAAQAQGYEFYTGGIEGSITSQLSIGSSWRLEEQDDDLLKVGNNEDGNANFAKGDAFSQIFKGSHELQLSYENYGGFVRGKYWYDYALADQNLDHGHTPNGFSQGSKLNDDDFNDLAKFKGAELLDAFVYGSFDLGEMPLDVRLGKQVVSWGESTFILGGVNSINPIDVSAFRRPGAEIKEGLIPVNMAYANMGVTDNLSVEAFYQLEFQETVISGCGTYFSTNDYAPEGCDGAITAAGTLSRAEDEKASDDGQFGFAMRYVSEAFGDTEFGLYAMNIHSRVPVLSGYKHSLNTAQVFTTNMGLTGGNAQQAIGLTVQQIAADTEYFAEYTEDIQITGLSFATNVGSVALSGEISHKQNVPLQINATQLIAAGLQADVGNVVGMPLGANSAELNEAVVNTAAGESFDGYRSFDIAQAQMTAIKFLDQFAGASRVTLIGEVGYTQIQDFDEDEDAIKFSRQGIFEPEGEFVNEGYVTESSWGYRARIVADYPDVFAGINLKPVIAWSHDVEGFAPQPGGAFREGNQSLGLTLKADYLNTYNASIGYTQYMGGDYNALEDRDFASISLGMQF